MRDRAEKLNDSRLKLRLAVRAAGIGIWDWDVATGRMEYSARARAICGFAPEEPITIEKVRAVTHPDDLPRTSQLARKALDPQVRAREPYNYRIIRADNGEVRWVQAHGEAVFADVDGTRQAVRYVGTISDITEGVAAEQTLRESELRLKLAIEAARMAVWEYDIATQAVIATPQLNRIFGLPVSARPTIDDLRERYYPGERERVLEAARKALDNGERQFEVEFRCRHLDGTVRWLLLRAEILFSDTGEMTRVLGVVLDIDDRKRAEDRQNLLLRELNHRVKNSLAVIQAIAGQTFRGDNADPAALADFQSRLSALARANDILLKREWEPFHLRELIEGLAQPYGSLPARVHVRGEDIELPSRFNVPLALIFHELATNAAKYGALSVPGGTVSIDVEAEPGAFRVTWREQGGPPVASKPAESFGTRLITRVLAVDVGKVDLEFTPEGVVCRIEGSI